MPAAIGAAGAAPVALVACALASPGYMSRRNADVVQEQMAPLGETEEEPSPPAGADVTGAPGGAPEEEEEPTRPGGVAYDFPHIPDPAVRHRGQ